MYFVTKQSKLNIDQRFIDFVDEDEAKTIITSMFQNAPLILDQPCLAIDSETTGLDIIKDDVLLVSFSDSKSAIVVDCTTVDFKSLIPDNYQDYTYIGQNIKYDCGILYNIGIELISVWDTMSMNQKYYQGANKSHNLVEICEKYLGSVPKYMDKDTREDFKGMTKTRAEYETRHILYSGTDVLYLHEIMRKQIEALEPLNLIRYWDLIGRYLIPAVARMERQGFILDEEKWKSNIDLFEEKAFEKACELDQIVLDLRDKFFLDPATGEREPNYYELVGGKFTNPRNRHPKINRIGLFGFELDDKTLFGVKKAPKPNTNNINWKSSDQVVEIFGKLKLELPTNDRNLPYAVPKFKEIRKGGSFKRVVDKDDYSFTTSKDAIDQLVLERPDHPGIDLLHTMVEYRKYDHLLNSFGVNFLDKVDRDTGKIYSLYRTDFAITGRFQSGGGSKLSQKFNNQNIPREDTIRTCFAVEPGYSVTTCDLSGAEVVTMCDKAHDTHLYEIAVVNDDAHSPIATACWRNVHLFRAFFYAGLCYTAKDFWAYKKKQNLLDLLPTYYGAEVKAHYDLSRTYTISKTENKDKRTQFKAITFGTVYGAMPYKIAKVLNITKEEATVVYDTIRTELAATFSMVESNVDFVMNNGYLLLNRRTNSRVLFPKVIHALKGTYTLSNREIAATDNAARNYPIQGTQADMVKEGIVDIWRFNKKHNLDCELLLTVHDENATKQPLRMDGVSNEWVSATRKDWVLFRFDSHLDPDLIHDWLFKHEEECERHIVSVDSWKKGDMTLRVSYPMFVKLSMCQAAWRYLDHYLMGADFEVAATWKK